MPSPGHRLRSSSTMSPSSIRYAATIQSWSRRHPPQTAIGYKGISSRWSQEQTRSHQRFPAAKLSGHLGRFGRGIPGHAVGRRPIGAADNRVPELDVPKPRQMESRKSERDECRGSLPSAPLGALKAASARSLRLPDNGSKAATTAAADGGYHDSTLSPFHSPG
jgi:hypothetical protein